MVGFVVSLTACVFLCGVIGYLNWFFHGSVAPNRWQRLVPTHQSDSTVLARLDLASSRRRRYKRLLTFVAGACVAGFCFSVALSGYLSPENRPAVPEVELGQTVFFNSKYGGVYVTHFEYLTVTYGLWVAIIFSGLIGIALKINLDEGSRVYPLLFFVGSATSMVLYYMFWQASLYLARS
jgi:hypothetical protein